MTSLYPSDGGNSDDGKGEYEYDEEKEAANNGENRLFCSLEEGADGRQNVDEADHSECAENIDPYALLPDCVGEGGC